MRLFTGIAALVLATGVAAGQVMSPVATSGTVTIAQALAALPRPHADGLRKKVLSLDATEAAFLFPSAGSVIGAGGTYWRSDVMLANYRSVAQRIGVGWIAQGVDNSTRPLQYYSIAANTPVFVADFVANQLGQSGLGSVLVVGAMPTGTAIDTNATLDGFSRIWTPQPNASGTVSLSFPGVTFYDSFGSALGYGLGLRHDSAYRTNVGIVNLDSVSHTWTVTINGSSASGSFNVTVLPASMRQVPLPSGNYGNLLVHLQADAPGFWWTAYGASVDNITGDGWISHVMQP
jgi:hypothetical protein